MSSVPFSHPKVTLNKKIVSKSKNFTGDRLYLAYPTSNNRNLLVEHSCSKMSLVHYLSGKVF